MNYKNLNYEIETNSLDVHNLSFGIRAMNYKNLNYEIETVGEGADMSQAGIDYEL